MREALSPPSRPTLAPPRLRAQGAAVRDDEGGPFPRLQRHLVGRAPAYHELYPAPAERLLDVREPFEHEGVVPEVRLRVVVGEAEDDEQAPAEVVGPLHRVLQGVVVVRPLGRLHPVQDVLAVPLLRVVEGLDTLILNQTTRHLSPPRSESPAFRTGA